MDKYISIILMCGLLILALISLILVYKNIRARKSKFYMNKKNLILSIILAISVSYFISSFNNFILFFRIEKFGNEIFSLVSSYKDVKGDYPTNSLQLTGYDHYKKIKQWKLGGLDHKFGFKGTFVPEENKLDFIFYAHGIDNDDDDLVKSYHLNYMYIFWPFLDGDMIVKESWTKQIDPFKDTL